MNNQQNTYDDSVFPKGFTFNGVSSKQLGFVVQTPPKYEMPEKDYTVTHVPGRVGDIVTADNNYQNVERIYNLATVYTPEGNGKLNPQIPVDNFVDKAEQLSAWLMSAQGYCDLTDGYEPQYIRKAMYIGGEGIEDILGQGFIFEAKFNCQPQRYFKDYYNLTLVEVPGTTPVAIPKPSLNSLINKNIFSEFLILLPARGGQVSANEMYIQLLDENNTVLNVCNIQLHEIIEDFGKRKDIYIDCFKQECYYNNDGSGNLNKYISFTKNEFFKLDITKNLKLKISNGGAADYEIYLAPRWYRI